MSKLVSINNQLKCVTYSDDITSYITRYQFSAFTVVKSRQNLFGGNNCGVFILRLWGNGVQLPSRKCKHIDAMTNGKTPSQSDNCLLGRYTRNWSSSIKVFYVHSDDPCLPRFLFLSEFTGDPLHSRAACTQPCNVNTHSRAHCSPGARLCEQWGHGCVNNGARLCASARLCRGSPVSLYTQLMEVHNKLEQLLGEAFSE